MYGAVNCQFWCHNNDGCKREASNSMSSFNLTETGGGSNTVGVSAPASISSNFVLKLPAADGSANQVIKTICHIEVGSIRGDATRILKSC